MYLPEYAPNLNNISDLLADDGVWDMQVTDSVSTTTKYWTVTVIQGNKNLCMCFEVCYSF